MKKIILILLISVGFSLLAYSEIVPMMAVIPPQSESLPVSVSKELQNKLVQIINTHGIGAIDASQFFVTCQLTTTNKEVLAGPPTMIAQNINATFYVVDGLTKKTFGSTSLTLKGVGNNETKAYMNAIKNIRPNSTELDKLILDSSKKIKQYYKDNFNTIMNKVDVLIQQQEYDEAIVFLNSISETVVNNDIVTSKLKQVWQSKIDREGNYLLNDAQTFYAVRDYDSAMETLRFIDPACNDNIINESKTLIASIKTAIDRDIKRLEDKEDKAYQDSIDLVLERLNRNTEVAKIYDSEARKRYDDHTEIIKEVSKSPNNVVISKISDWFFGSFK